MVSVFYGSRTERTMSRWKLVALDMDGTLLTSDKRLLPETVRDIEKASESGVEFCFCSGRTVPEIRLFTDQLPMIRYAVCMSGSVVLDLENEQTLYRHAVKQKYVFRILEAAAEDDSMVHLLTDRDSVVRGDQVTHMAEFGRPDFQETFLVTTRSVPDLYAEAEHYDSIPKVNIYARSADVRQRAFEKLKDLPLTIEFIEETSLEINALGVSKAVGMQALTDHIGITMADVMAIGDSENDRAVLQAAGFPVAMANSGESILSLCHAVTGDNDHNGVGEAVRRYLLP